MSNAPTASAVNVQIETLCYAEALQALKAAREAGVTVGLEGNPGVGKSACAVALSEETHEPLYTLIGSNCEPTDIGGIPCVIDGALERIPLRAIRECAVKPGLFFMDELTTVPKSVHGPLLRGLLEKTFGDVTLHRDSFTFCAWNPPGQAPGGQHLSAATGSRILQIRLEPVLEEYVDFFSKLGRKEGNAALQAEGMDFAATIYAQPTLLCPRPPAHALHHGTPWASPRGWERGLRAFVAAGSDKDNKVARALLTGAVGREAALAYLAIKDLRKELPNMEQICEDPHRAALPKDPTHQVAAVGLLVHVAQKDQAAAWIYTARLRPEFQFAVARSLLNHLSAPMSARWMHEGNKISVDMLCEINRMQRRTKIA
jgi:hypothetical protein